MHCSWWNDCRHRCRWISFARLFLSFQWLKVLNHVLIIACISFLDPPFRWSGCVWAVTACFLSIVTLVCDCGMHRPKSYGDLWPKTKPKSYSLRVNGLICEFSCAIYRVLYLLSYSRVLETDVCLPNTLWKPVAASYGGQDAGLHIRLFILIYFLSFLFSCISCPQPWKTHSRRHFGHEDY